MRVKALKRFRYDKVEHQEGEEFDMQERHLRAMLLVGLVKQMDQPAAPAAPPAPAPGLGLRSRQVKAEEVPRADKRLEPPPAKYKRRDMQAED